MNTVGIEAKSAVDSLSGQFRAVARHATKTTGLEPVRRFLGKDAWVAATVLASQHLRKVTRLDEDSRYDLAAEIAAQSIQTLKNQLAAGKLTNPKRPIESLAGYLTEVIKGKYSDAIRTKTPPRIAKVDPLADEMFQQVVVRGRAIEQVALHMAMSNPSKARLIRATLVPLIQKELLNPPKLSNRAKDPAPALSQVMASDSAEYAADTYSYKLGTQYRDCVEELEYQACRESLEQAIDGLDEEYRSYMRAYYPEFPKAGDLARDFGVEKPAAVIRRLRRALQEALATETLL